MRGWLRGGDPCGTSPFSRTAPSHEAVGEAAVRPSRGKTPCPAKILSPGGSGRGFVEGGKLHLRLCPPSLPGPWVNSVHRVKVSWPPLAMIPVSTPPCPFSVVAHHHHHHHHLCASSRLTVTDHLWATQSPKHKVFVVYSLQTTEVVLLRGCLVSLTCPTLCNVMDCILPGCSVHGDSPGKNTGLGCHALLQGIVPTQGSNTGLLHCRRILSHQSIPRWSCQLCFTVGKLRHGNRVVRLGPGN